MTELRTGGAIVVTAVALFLPGGAAHAQQAPSASGYRPGPVESGGTVAGRAVFEGDVPRPRRFLVTKDVEVCGIGYRERQEVEVAPEGGLRNVVVAIEGVEAGKPWPERPARAEVAQENCVFAPHVQVVASGEELDILNPDPVLHNIHAFELIGSASRTLFNLGQPPEKPKITHEVRPRRGHRIRLECDAHDFMLGWIYAAETPYAVLVDADGRFALDGVPPGEYTVQAWHPYLGTREQRVTVAPNGEVDVVFLFSSG